MRRPSSVRFGRSEVIGRGGGVWKVLKWLFDGDSGSKALDNAHMSLICLLTAHIFTSAKAICWFVGDPNCFHTASSKR